MDLGGFSISLAVRNLLESKAFYEKLGFKVADGDSHHNWLIMRSGDSTIGLFQGMFDKNLLTFNPPDVRAIRESLGQAGVTLQLNAAAMNSEDGPAHGTLTDPDGNVIMLDQLKVEPGWRASGNVNR